MPDNADRQFPPNPRQHRRAFSTNMADYADDAFESLPQSYRELLSAYEIGPDDWGKIAAARIDVDGTRYVIPEQVGFDDATDAAGRRAARRSRDELTTKLQSFFSDRMDAAVLQPGDKERAILLRGSQPGTLTGEGLRAMALFKSFPTTVITRVWGERLAQSDYAGLATTILGMWAMGSLAIASKDALRGQAPPDFSDPAAAGKYAMRAFTQGGGAGILGDFFMGEYNRYGAGLAGTLGGPVVGQFDSIASIYAKLIRGEDAGADAFRALWNNAPGANLFYARTALNYFLLYPMQELMNPGYLRRMEKRREKDTGQQYFLPPSNAA